MHFIAKPKRQSPPNLAARRASIGHTERFSNWLAELGEDDGDARVAFGRARSGDAATHPGR
jgi:hypothetical protein